MFQYFRFLDYFKDKIETMKSDVHIDKSILAYLSEERIDYKISESLLRNEEDGCHKIILQIINLFE